MKKHPSAFSPKILGLNILLSFVGIVVGLELITRLGVTPNTSIIGALVAIGISCIPVRAFRDFTDVHSQNLVQTSISAATFVAGNCVLIPLGVLWLLNMKELMLSMFLGSAIGTIVSITMVYWLFNTKIFPAENPWPPGIATAETIEAAAKKGKEALNLLYGGIAGGLLNGLFGIPADVIGISWIGNIWALVMFGVGLLVRGYSPAFGVDINAYYIPHGVMIGAGIVALVQILWVIRKSESKGGEGRVGLSLGKGFAIYVVGAVLIAMLSGLYAQMSFSYLISWILFAAFGAIFAELLVGLSAMHAGWFPAFAIALIVLVLGMLIGFPSSALALLVGYAASVGPAFADMGYDLKTGWILRGEGKDPEFEREGRRQQYFAELTGAFMALAIAYFAHTFYFAQELFPPVDFVYSATIEAGASLEVAKMLLMWAIPGAIVQAIGGPARQIGVLFATGLLIYNPIAGFAVLAGILFRIIIVHNYGDEGQNWLYIMGAGMIAGSAITSFATSTMKIGR
jgi:uncharacterized oligopeptide transporter (OPT) family protein